MAKSPSSNDPDDVLESIRRLVVHDAKGGGATTRGRAVPAAPPELDSIRRGHGPAFQPWTATAAHDAARGAAKLLLTEDFLIEDTVPAEAPALDPTPIATPSATPADAAMPAAPTGEPADEVAQARAEISAFLKGQDTDAPAQAKPAQRPTKDAPAQDPLAAARQTLRNRPRDPAPGTDTQTGPAQTTPDPQPVLTPDPVPAAPGDAEFRARVESAVLDTLKSVGDAPLAPATEFQIDEEALREMVGDIVKRELQGALGERITRNVRKLVRREIYRALEARNLD